MASLSSVRSTQSELAPTLTSSRYHQLHTPRYTVRQVSSTPHDKQAGGKRSGKKKVTTTHSSSQRAASSEASKEGPSDHVPFKIDSTSSSYRERPHQEYYKAGKMVVPTRHVLDSGYSSGTGPTPKVSLRLSSGQLSAGNEGVASRNKVSTSAPFSGSPALSHPVCVSIPASVHVVGRGEGKRNRWGEESTENLERGRVKQLEHEVTVLEQQLSEKTQAARSHVEDLTCLRSELARERSALARVSVSVNLSVWV